MRRGVVVFQALPVGARFRLAGDVRWWVKVGPARCRGEGGRLVRVDVRVHVVPADDGGV